MRALIQKHRGEFANINVLTAFLGFKEKGYAVEFFEFGEFEAITLDHETVVVGGIRAVVSALQRLAIEVPGLISIPKSIADFAKRRYWTGTIGEARNSVDQGKPLFIKPVPNDRKLFGGMVVASYRDLSITAALPSYYPVMCSDPVVMVAE